MWIAASNISSHIDLNPEKQNSNTLTSVREFFAEKVSLLLENKTYTAAAFTLMFAAGMNISDSKKSQEIEIEKVKTPAPQITLKITRNEWDNTKLWSVRFDGQEYLVNIDEKLILSQAKKYELDYEMLKWFMEINEIWTFDFVNYLSQTEYEKKENKYSYIQLLEAVQDLHSLEYLIEQQSISESNKQEAQRIFNEKLRNKQYVSNFGSDIIKKSNKYDLILAAAGDNYQFIFWENYSEYIEDQAENQQSMRKVTERIDQWDYDESTLALYLEQFKSFIESETWVSMDDYKSYIASINNTEMIAQNNIEEKRENY